MSVLHSPFFAVATPQATLSAYVESDAELVRRARAGERDAEKCLYVRHVHYVEGLLVRLLGIGTVGGTAMSSTTTAASGTAPVVEGSAVLGLRVPLWGAMRAALGAEVGGVIAGIDAHVDGRRAAGFGGVMAGVGLGVGWGG